LLKSVKIKIRIIPVVLKWNFCGFCNTNTDLPRKIPDGADPDHIFLGFGQKKSPTFVEDFVIKGK